ncbi:MAG: O-methyltransferase [Betaproteobacteria bacterium]|nr:O-methyltransferase [Betaproteobacteria bacterium]
MSAPIKSFACTIPELAQYAHDCFQPEDLILAEIRERAVQEKLPNIHVGRMDGLHLEVLVRATGAKKAVEIGSLAGYSGVCIARALPPDGHLHAFELYEKNARVCAETFQRAGYSSKITIHQGVALENLKHIENQGPFDLIFLDADKHNYPAYLSWAEQHLRVGGTLIADNTFAWGLILQNTFDTESQRRDAEGVLQFNAKVAKNAIWRATILPTGEGLTVAVKIASRS